MDTTRSSQADITVDRSLVDSIALDDYLPGEASGCPCASASCQRSWSSGCALGLDDLFGAPGEEEFSLEVVAVRMVGGDDDLADDGGHKAQADALAAELATLKTQSATEIADLRRLLALAAAALEPHSAPSRDAFRPNEAARIYTAITQKIGLSTPILEAPA